MNLPKIDYTFYTFDTRDEARAWLAEYGFKHMTGTLGVWERADGQEVEAFKNQHGYWTVARYVARNPDNFISE